MYSSKTIKKSLETNYLYEFTVMYVMLDTLLFLLTISLNINMCILI